MGPNASRCPMSWWRLFLNKAHEISMHAPHPPSKYEPTFGRAEQQTVFLSFAFTSSYSDSSFMRITSAGITRTILQPVLKIIWARSLA